MDGSPRSSKRRKLDTPSRMASSSPAKGSTKKPSGRAGTRSAPKSTGKAGIQEKELKSTTSRRDRQTSAASKATPRTRPTSTADGGSVYDDIDGALGEEPPPATKRHHRERAAPRSSRSLRSVSKAEPERAVGDTDELQTNGDTPSHRVFRSMVNRYQHASGNEADIQDELAAELCTSTKRRRTGSIPSTRNPNRRNQMAEKEGGDEKSQVAVSNGAQSSKARPAKQSGQRNHAEDSAEDEIVVTTPSQSSKRRKQVEKHRSSPDSEEKWKNRGPRNSRTNTVAARRHVNRTDHFGNAEQNAAEEVTEDGVDVDGNSALGSILDPTEPSPFNKPLSAQKERAAELPFASTSLPIGRELDLLKTIVVERITGKRPAPLVGLEEEYQAVHQLVEHTITAGEGNSMLLIGARGSGKSALINKVISEVLKENREDFHVVRLNGFIHTDDKIALREIWRQLGKEMAIEEENGGVGKNYADTLATLLALLSHPSEQTGEVTDHVAKAVVFLIDEFDLFAQHPRQTLLYNLFDIAQSRKAPIAVLGLTTRIDVTNSLEKRVKSRFSHRYANISLAKSFTLFQDMCKANLVIQSDQLNVEERAMLETIHETTPERKGKKRTNNDKGALHAWNSHIEALFTSETFLTQILAPHFYRSKSIPTVLNTFLLPAATLARDVPLGSSTALSPPDSKLCLIPMLSTLSLSLLISAARLDIIHDSDTCNFNMAYDEYVTLASKARIQSAAGGTSASGSLSKVWSKDVARKEWEELVELGLIMPVVATSISGGGGGFGMIRVDVALEEIDEVLKSEKGSDKGLERWCRQI